MKYVYVVLKTEILTENNNSLSAKKIHEKEQIFTDVIGVFTSIKQLKKYQFFDSDNVFYEVKKMLVNEIIQDDFIKGIENLFSEGKIGIKVKKGKIQFMPFKKG